MVDMEVERLIKASRHYPTRNEIRKHNCGNADYYPINSLDFPRAYERLSIINLAKEAFYYIRDKTQMESVEYTITFYGRREGRIITVPDYCFAKGTKNSANYSDKQKAYAQDAIADGRETIYGHTHTSLVSAYNSFSISDLKYIIKVALQTGKDAYGLLITHDNAFAIKYDIDVQDFFRLEILI